MYGTYVILSNWDESLKKKYNCLHCTTKLDVDANFTENYTFVQDVGRNNVFPNLQIVYFFNVMLIVISDSKQ